MTQRWSEAQLKAYEAGKRAALPATVKGAELADANTPEGEFATQLTQAGIAFERQVKFHVARRWRFDFVLTATRFAIEVQGGLWTGGAHVRPAALVKEYEKLNEAALAGWNVLLVEPQSIANGAALALIRRALKTET